MVELGYALSSEEHRPNDLVRYARQAEEAGFTFALISDHYHPWIDRQGQAPFVWSVIGGIAQVTDHLRLGTGVTCPTMRIHPAIIAQAAATVGDMLPGRFFLGVGTGENLNEHILADNWPGYNTRLEMLEEAVEVIRQLWSGDYESFYGAYYVVENARIYTLPDELPPIMVAASGSESAAVAGRIGDGLISTAPKSEVVSQFRSSGGDDKPRYAQVTVCWAETEAQGRQTALEIWPTSGLPGALSQELPLPMHFEAAAKLVTEDDIAELIVCGPDPQRHIAGIRKFVDAGFDHVYIHQIGPNQTGFLNFYCEQVLPEFR